LSNVKRWLAAVLAVPFPPGLLPVRGDERAAAKEEEEAAPTAPAAAPWGEEEGW